jgi:hypothetical protein
LAPLAAECGFPISGIWAARGAVGLRRDSRRQCLYVMTHSLMVAPLMQGRHRTTAREPKRFHAFVGVG